MSNTKNSIVNRINKQLKLIGGTNIYGDPNFRCVFSDDQLEKRKGTFNEFYGKIFVRTVTTVKEVQKYPWIKRRWIIERWASGEMSYHPDLETDKNGVYICVYVFQDKNYDPLPPVLWAAEYVVNNLFNPIHKAKMAERDKQLDEKVDEDELNKIELDLKIRSDESKTRDHKSIRESLSIGYGKAKKGTKI